MFYNKVYVLAQPEKAEAKWQEVGALTVPLAYGVGVTLPDGVACIGGTDGSKSYATATLLQYTNGALQQKA